MQMIVRRWLRRVLPESVSLRLRRSGSPSWSARQGALRDDVPLLKDHVHQTDSCWISAPTMAPTPAPVAAGGERVRLRAGAP